MSPRSSSAQSSEQEKQSSVHTDIEQLPIDETTFQQFEPTTAPEIVDPYHPSQFPDGGKDAWLCLLGSFCCLFCSFGWLNCLGIFQSYYQLNQLREYSHSTIAWIVSLEIFVMFFPGPIVGWVNDSYGPKYILIFGAFFHVFGLMMTSLCEEYWQFILAQGICSPLGLQCILQAGTSTLPTWFLKKRGLAFGMIAAGSGLGGVILPIMASHLIPDIGFAWTMRTFGFMILGMMTIASLTVKSRLPLKPRPFKLKVFMEPFHDLRYVFCVMSATIIFMAVFIPVNFIEVQAISDGMSLHLAGYLLPILNAAGIFGRIIPGGLADIVGSYNMQTLCSFLSGIIVLALGLTASSNAAYITFAALYGFASGAFIALLPAQMSAISKVEEIGVRVGVAFAIIAFAGLVGNPIAGALIDHNDGKFWGLNVFTGVILLAGASMCLFTRMYLAKWQLFVKV